MPTDGTTDWPYVELQSSAEWADAIGGALIDAGAVGVEQRDGSSGEVTLVAWFEANPDLADLERAISAVPGLDSALAADACRSLRTGQTPDDDWLRLWKRGFEPIDIGDRLLVFPSWKRDALDQDSNRVRVEIDPGMAFGTGTHETTRLCLEWLDANWHGGSLLDAGTGTGILAIAAARLEPDSTIVAVDIDPQAVEIARENARINGVLGRIDFDSVSPDALAERGFDVVLANLTADVIVGLGSVLRTRVADAGHLVLSGILNEQADDVLDALGGDGFALRRRSSAGEWTALALQRT